MWPCAVSDNVDEDVLALFAPSVPAENVAIGAAGDASRNTSDQEYINLLNANPNIDLER